MSQAQGRCSSPAACSLLARRPPRRPRPGERERIVAAGAPPGRGAELARDRAASSPPPRARSASSSSTRSTGCPRRRSCSASRSGSRSLFLAAALIVIGEAAGRRPRSSRRTTREPSIRPSRSGSSRSSRRAAPLTRRRLLGSALGAAGGSLGARAARARRLARARCSTSARFYVTPWRRGTRLVDEHGRPLRADEIEEKTFYTAFPEGADQEQLASPLVVVRLAAERSSTCRPERAAWRRRDRRLLEDLHPRRLRDLALPRAALRADRAEAGARLPVPLLDLRPGDRRHGDLRPGRPQAADAAADGRPQRRAARRAATSTGRSARPGGACGCGGRRRDPRHRPLRSTSARGTAPLLRKTLRYLFPDHWSFLLGEVALYAFIVLVAHRHLPDALLRATAPRRRLPRRLRAAAGAAR